MKIQTYYVTFGVMYKEFPATEEEAHPQGMHGRGYAAIEAPSEEVARSIAFAVFGHQWAFLYERQPNHDTYTSGELMRLTWRQPASGHGLLVEPSGDSNLPVYAECECSNHDGDGAGRGAHFGYVRSEEEARDRHAEHLRSSADGEVYA